MTHTGLLSTRRTRKEGEDNAKWLTSALIETVFIVTLEQVAVNQLDFHACMAVVQRGIKYTVPFVPLKLLITKNNFSLL